jgi:hypothetical protein
MSARTTLPLAAKSASVGALLRKAICEVPGTDPSARAAVFTSVVTFATSARYCGSVSVLKRP